MKKHGGDITKADLAAYKAKIRSPLAVSYRGFTIETMPPPSMGGIAVAETLLQLERRSEERRVGKECTAWCRSRWSPYH